MDVAWYEMNCIEATVRRLQGLANEGQRTHLPGQGHTVPTKFPGCGPVHHARALATNEHAFCVVHARKMADPAGETGVGEPEGKLLFSFGRVICLTRRVYTRQAGIISFRGWGRGTWRQTCIYDDESETETRQPLFHQQKLLSRRS